MKVPLLSLLLIGYVESMIFSSSAVAQSSVQPTFNSAVSVVKAVSDAEGDQVKSLRQ